MLAHYTDATDRGKSHSAGDARMRQQATEVARGGARYVRNAAG